MSGVDLAQRPLAWCLVGRATPVEADLADRLALDWGAGACYLAGAPGWADAPARLPETALERLSARARLLVAWSDQPDPDDELHRRALAAGALPVQAMSPFTARRAAEFHPDWPSALRLVVDEAPLAPPPDLDDVAVLEHAAACLVSSPALAQR